MKAFWCVLPVLLLAGCAKTSSETQLATDGSFTRTVRFAVSQGMGDGQINFDEYFEAPKGADWKVERKTPKEGELEVTATRSFPAGATAFTDVIVKGPSNTQKAVNQVEVKVLPNGNLEYTETYTWKAKEGSSDFMRSDEKAKASIKNVLPEGFADEKETAELARQTALLLFRIVFGPPEPMLLSALTNPEFFERRVKRTFGLQMEALLEKRYGDKLTAAQRREIVLKMLKEFDAKETLSSPEEKGQESQSDKTGLASITSVVKLPGRLVETNGEHDPYSNEVAWAMFVESASPEPVVLRVVCEPKP